MTTPRTAAGQALLDVSGPVSEREHCPGHDAALAAIDALQERSGE